MIQTQIAGVEGEQADHQTTTTVWCVYLSLWPDTRIKSTQNYPNVTQKVAAVVFT